MKLDNIELENFRQYCGIHRADFSKDPKRNITVFQGSNGAGKTSLFAAINWCLYGEGAENIGELISKEAARSTQVGRQVTARVKLSFRHGAEHYVSLRELVGVKNEQGKAEVQETPKFTLMKLQSDGQAVEVKNPVGTMNTILPSNVRTFFLFDGEKIDNFSKPECAEEVRYAIYNVLKLEILERAKNHLAHIASEYRRELRQYSSGELAELIDEEEKSRKEKEEALAKLQNVEKERESAKKKIADIDKRLRELQGARDLQSRRDRTQEELEARESDLRSVIREIRDLLSRCPSMIALEAQSKARSILDKKRERGEIPSGIRQQFVRDLLEQEKCICGRPIKKGEPAHEHLKELLNRRVSDTLEDKVLNTAITLSILQGQQIGVPAQLASAMKKKSDLEDAIKDLNSELDDVNRLLKGSPLEEISGLEGQRHGFQLDIERYLLDIGKLRGTIESCDREIAELTKQRELAQKRKNKDDLLAKKVSLGQKSADAIEKIHVEFGEDMRKKIEAKTKEIFRRLVWKNSHFKDVILGPDYLLEVVDRYNSPARPELSAGERQVLSLSFITAMVQVSEEEAPIVMDTPFGRLSSEHRATITENLPKLAPQLVLFVTDEELRDEARKNLRPHIGYEYRLTFNNKTSTTTIEEVRP